MKQFTFIDKYSSVIITVSAENEDEAKEIVIESLQNLQNFRIEDTEIEE